MISREEAYNETMKRIDSKDTRELERFGEVILNHVKECYFSFACPTRSMSENTLNTLKEKGYDIKEFSNDFDGPYYEVSWGPKKEE